MCIHKFILSAAIIVSVQAQASTFNIRDYGAKADKKTNDASAIQKTIDKCSETGGGIVYCPSGDYLSGVIQLKSNVTVHLKHCQRVFIDGVTILNNFYRTNADGIDPHSCRDVHISNCNITAGDDCICLKTTKGNPCENIVVTNCTLETVATAIKFGTASQGDFRDIRVFVKDDVLAQYPRSALSLNECASGVIRSIFRTADAGDKAEPVVTMHNCRDMLLTNNLAPLGTRVFLGLTGNKTAHISLAANELTNAENKVTQSKDVPKAALKK